MSNRKVKLSDSANIFHDPYSGVTICKGEVIELSVAQMANKRVRTAINSGHLVLAIEESSSLNTELPKKDLKELLDKFNGLIEKPVKTIVKKFTLEQLKAIAISLGFELEEEDTKESLVESIIGELTDSDK